MNSRHFVVADGVEKLEGTDVRARRVSTTRKRGIVRLRAKCTGN